MKNKVFLYFILFLFLLPLLYINVKTSHDWGDDFAQYIIQAKSIFSPSDSNPGAMCLTYYSPQYRPIGFPALLSPFYYFFGNNIYVFMLFVSSILVLLCLCMFRLFSLHFSLIVSFVLILVFAYNPDVLSFKSEIMAEIPFTLFLILGVNLYLAKRKNYILFTIIIASILLLIKYIGIVFILAVIIDVLVKYFISYKKKEVSFNLNYLFCFILYVFIPFGVFILVNQFIFKIPFGSEVWYNKYFMTDNWLATMYHNLIYYKNIFLLSFEQEVPQYANVFIKTTVLIFLLIGFGYKIIRKISIIEYITILYLLVILIYPYTRGSFKFIFPIIPFLWIYVISGIKILFSRLTIKSEVSLLIYLMLILFSYSINVKTIIKETPLIQSGPQEADFVQSVDYIHLVSTTEDCFLFVKPWAFNLYTNRKVVPLAGNDNSVSFHRCLSLYNVKFILAGNKGDDQYDENLFNLISIEKNYLPIWKNNSFTLFEKDK